MVLAHRIKKTRFGGQVPYLNGYQINKNNIFFFSLIFFFFYVPLHKFSFGVNCQHFFRRLFKVILPVLYVSVPLFRLYWIIVRTGVVKSIQQFLCKSGQRVLIRKAEDLSQKHYTSENPVQYFLFKRLVKWCNTIITNKIIQNK